MTKLLMFTYISEDKNQIMLAIPDIFWSIELDLNMDSNDVKEELVMQLFAFIEENEAIKIASNLTNWTKIYLNSHRKYL